MPRLATGARRLGDATITDMDELGVHVVIRDAVTLDDVGECTAPGPVRPDDIIALEHGDPYRIIATLPVPEGSPCVPVLARRIALTVGAR